ncbi:MAG TPA: hypothetical protein VMS55_03365 [Myxococcota bacterium]|nr:hypothetical protein [Myxococcota bacterium]
MDTDCKMDSETLGIVEQDFSQVMARLAELKASGVRDFRRQLSEYPELAREALDLLGIVNEAAANAMPMPCGSVL